MGMFDYVTCDYPLPGRPADCATLDKFQTKDLTCWMKHYTITADGLLTDEIAGKAPKH